MLKAPQRITHQKRLGDVGADVSYFLDTAAVLGPKLGPRPVPAPAVLQEGRAAAPRLPGPACRAQPRTAFEFRHESWFDDEVYEALRERKAALCLADTDDEGRAAAELPATADWGYLRLRRANYEEEDLQAWAARIRGQAWERAFVFFKHEDEARGPALASRFAALLG